jgi:hypothetical protein
VSVVTGITLVCSITDSGHDEDEGYRDHNYDAMHLVQEWLAKRFDGLQLTETSRSANGKASRSYVWVAGINHMGDAEDPFVEYVMSLGWYAPENVVLILQPEEGVTRVFRPPFKQPGREH